MKLRMKLSLTFIVTILFALIALGGLSFLTTQRIFSEEIKEVSESLVEEMSGNITRELEMYRHALSVMRINESLQKAYYERDIRMLTREFSNYIDEFDAVSNIYVGYKNKEFYIYPESEVGEDFDPMVRPCMKRQLQQKDLYGQIPMLTRSMIRSPYPLLCLFMDVMIPLSGCWQRI